MWVPTLLVPLRSISYNYSWERYEPPLIHSDMGLTVSSLFVNKDDFDIK